MSHFITGLKDVSLKDVGLKDVSLKDVMVPFYSRQFNIFKPFCLVLSQLLWAPLTVVCDCLNEKLPVKLQPPVYDIKHRQSIFVWPSD